MLNSHHSKSGVPSSVMVNGRINGHPVMECGNSWMSWCGPSSASAAPSEYYNRNGWDSSFVYHSNGTSISNHNQESSFTNNGQHNLVSHSNNNDNNGHHNQESRFDCNGQHNNVYPNPKNTMRNTCP